MRIIFCFVAFPLVKPKKKDHEYEMKYVFYENLGEKKLLLVFIYSFFVVFCIYHSARLTIECVYAHSNRTVNANEQRK